MMHVPEKFRVVKGKAASDSTYGNNGAFLLPFVKGNFEYFIYIIASDGEAWEHVSAHVLCHRGKDMKRCPTWEEMCTLKDIFWDADDCVIQFHPSKSEYVNIHSSTLHLWKPIGVEIPTPQKVLV